MLRNHLDCIRQLIWVTMLTMSSNGIVNFSEQGGDFNNALFVQLEYQGAKH